jgi:nitroimidazol reductase NimA-like FMN-containing flavoprotein (pyridoxamine 5'-phosphate oxidase superfamily)
VGRLAFVRDGDIEVLPVNHCVVDRTIAFRAAGGSKLTAAYYGDVVAFQVDSYDPRRRTGWSVLVKGRVELVTDSSLVARLDAAGLRTWSPSAPRAEWVVIRADGVSGRRL